MDFLLRSGTLEKMNRIFLGTLYVSTVCPKGILLIVMNGESY